MGKWTPGRCWIIAEVAQAHDGTGLEQGDVAVSPGSGFGPAGEGFLRMALVENENRLRQAVRHIQRCLTSEKRFATSK